MNKDDSTVEAVPAVTGVEETQPVTQNEADTTEVKVEADSSEAQQDTSESSTDNPVEQSAPEVDDKLKKYAESQGIDLDSPSAIKAAKIALASQSEATRNYQRSRELESTMGEMSDASAQQVAQATGQDPALIQRLQRMEVKESIRDFFDAKPEARKYEAEMSKIATEAGLYGSPEAILKASYAMALANDTSSVDTARSQGKEETLRSLAHKQQAAVPTGNATTSGTSTSEKPFAELSIAEMERKLGFGPR